MNEYFGKKTRKAAGGKPSSSYAIIDSKSVKTVFSYKNKRIDGGKKVKMKTKSMICPCSLNMHMYIIHLFGFQ